MSRNILIVEDEALIALDLEVSLTAENFTVGGVAKTIPEAMAFISAGGIDAALLDAFLNRESSAPIAHALTAAGIPFVVISGYEAKQLEWVDPNRFVSKPYKSEEVCRILNDLCT